MTDTARGRRWTGTPGRAGMNVVVTSRPTMNDVAREAGVALKTVSRYVNGETNINSVMAGRIAEAIAHLGYRRNLSAASLRPGWTSRTIGLVISDLANPHWAALARGVERAATARGYLLVTGSSEEDGTRHDAIVDRMLDQRLDGLIVVPPRIPGRPWASLVPPVPPVVFVDREIDTPGARCITADDRGGAHAAVAALVAGGARRIAVVGDSLGIPAMAARVEGYRSALAAAGLPADPALVHDGAHSAEQAERIVGVLLSSAGPTVDAVFAANNRSSLGALQAFRAAGRRLPLVGFDDFEVATLLDPPVSVVCQDVDAMGATAVSVLLDTLEGAADVPSRVVLPTTLHLRGSER